jgi:hypothetical protein
MREGEVAADGQVFLFLGRHAYLDDQVGMEITLLERL